MNVRASELDALNKQGMTPIQAWHTAVEQIGNFSSLFPPSTSSSIVGSEADAFHASPWLSCVCA